LQISFPVLRLKAEARLGELIKQEQAAGRLATGKGITNKPTPNNDVRGLKDYGLTWQDSSRAQQVYEHQDLMPGLWPSIILLLISY
jgi:hypothetical protein